VVNRENLVTSCNEGLCNPALRGSGYALAGSCCADAMKRNLPTRRRLKGLLLSRFAKPILAAGSLRSGIRRFQATSISGPDRL
jgi:hypothetical protein